MITPPTITKESIVPEVESLRNSLAALTGDDGAAQAAYHCERLALALRTSHNEGTRFAAFTVNRLVRTHPEWPAEIATRMQAIRASLEATGIDFGK